jgi:hypothetical protein
MKSSLLVLTLAMAVAGCATANPRRVQAPAPALAERTTPGENNRAIPKRPVPRWVAPPPAYGNRVVLFSDTTEPDTGGIPSTPEG